MIVDIIRDKELEIAKLQNPQVIAQNKAEQSIVEEKAKAILRKNGFQG
jgi:hypothetical protein